MNTIDKKIPYHKKPEDMSIDTWQIILRKQFGIKQDFTVCNIGNHPVFSDFTVYNPETESTYKVAIRSLDRNKGNFCSCPDFTINTLGTCKHIEYLLYTLQSDHQKQKYLDDEVYEKKSSLSIRYEIERRLFLNIMPGRTDKTYFVDMTAEQLKFHQNYHDNVVQIVSKWKKKGILTQEERQILLINLNCMRMSCDSTYILDQTQRHDTKINELMKILEDVFTDIRIKVIIFSQWVKMNDLAAQELDRRQIRYEYLHGGVPAHKRNKLIENFHSDDSCRVFLSTDAGGVGLNLQCASLLINLDIPWNPAVLEQRIGRIYRLGQKEKVRIINMVSQGTIEHRILYLLGFKKSLFKGVLEDGEDTVLMNEEGVKSFMESIEELTSIEGNSDIYFTPHAIQSDEVYDFEIENKPNFSAVTDEGKNSIGNNVKLTVKKKLHLFLKKLKGLLR